MVNGNVVAQIATKQYDAILAMSNARLAKAERLLADDLRKQEALSEQSKAEQERRARESASDNGGPSDGDTAK